MVEGIDAVWAFLTAALVTLLLVRPAEALARRVGAIDEPGPRSQHTFPTPRMSGLAILAGIEVAGWIWLPVNTETLSIMLGALVVALVGALDDMFDLPPWVKLLGQLGAATIPVVGGVYPANLTVPFFGGFELGWVAYPLTVLGIALVMNIVNLIDGIDGLAAGFCAIAAAAMAANACTTTGCRSTKLAAV